MIGNQTKGKSFRGLLNYLENREKSSLIGGNMFGTNAAELAREFRLSRQLNPEAQKVVHHVSLSLTPGEQLDNETWCEIADKYIEAMGYTANQYAIYRHNDRDHDHIHICASRISLDNGKITSDSWEYVRSEKIIRQLELEYSLQQAQSSKEKLNRAPSIGQQRRIEREQLEYEQGQRNTPPQQAIKTQLIELIDRATIDQPTMPQMIERLQLLGVEVRHGLTRNGKSKGISYAWNEQKFSGTSLGAAYTFPGLQKHKEIDYQPQRDDQPIQQLLLNPVKPISSDEVQKFLQEIEQKQQLPFTPPAEDESLWPALKNYLTEKRGISSAFAEALHEQGLTYVDQQRAVVFIKWDLDREKSGALIWHTRSQDNLTVEYDKTTKPSPGWFHLRVGGKPGDTIERVFLCDTPIDALSVAEIDMISHKGLPPVRTMYMAVDDPNNLPLEYFKDVSRIGLAFNNNAQGHETASAVLELLPQSKRLPPDEQNWNEDLLALLHQQELERSSRQRQQDRGLSR
ncbi:relaxase/mobilization nuclease domain-containing protein [Nodularia sp. UHCC 0506]|uniref:relaxase/mobilization nuclease domain-containing protein n=1 Tax=Nodularia sp. UHCC 0506 TaxID=3110243 RepID=UPI002B218573|nr:relaxase/mobilization nuclease domain-containing protein [Nodularia sp. UHCC 0506]MEA5516772.1 relaxase/mobilization nuclease domain-containing protein [Nodularia sp. UHCC 0506]